MAKRTAVKHDTGEAYLSAQADLGERALQKFHTALRQAELQVFEQVLASAVEEAFAEGVEFANSLPRQQLKLIAS